MMKFKSLLFALVAGMLVMFGSVSQSYAQSLNPRNTGAYNTYVAFAPGDDGTQNVYVGSASFYDPTQYHSTSTSIYFSDVDSAVSYLEYSSRTGAGVSYNGSAGNCSMGGMIVPCKMLF